MIVKSFRENMIKAGFNPPSEINADGKFHRFSTNGKPSDDAGWYVLNQYPIAVGSFGCWRSGLTGSWSAVEERNMTQKDRTKYKQAIPNTSTDRFACQFYCKCTPSQSLYMNSART